jgi:hypothetical protein
MRHVGPLLLAATSRHRRPILSAITTGLMRNDLSKLAAIDPRFALRTLEKTTASFSIEGLKMTSLGNDARS